ncbi:hypothetical protein AURDEDRAFT_185172 [Auricularia subglabra TFB-10046 SS5]|nr:hypothetical protein AURDEDRAFT_185172 [Auricularia subglabra TFB-10046 SS5]
MFPFRQLIPSVAIPASIQSRFLSFALKRSIGHLLKPGQLDPAQIEAQIGSGFVEVKDIQLDDDAINEFLSDLPVRLVTGVVGTVTARVPWPNILSATFTLSLSSVHLVFAVAPPRPKHTRNLTESVALVAEEFVHEELTPEENKELRKSIILTKDDDNNSDDDDDANYNPPGSIDPWLKKEDLDEVQDVEAAIEGVSVLASVVERILARFTLKANDIKLSLIHENVAELTLGVEDVAFGVDQQDADRTDDKRVHTCRVTGVSVSMRDLAPPPRSAPSSSAASSVASLASTQVPPPDMLASQRTVPDMLASQQTATGMLASQHGFQDMLASQHTIPDMLASQSSLPEIEDEHFPSGNTPAHSVASLRSFHTTTPDALGLHYPASAVDEDDSDMDENAMMAMSQSIASLAPPRPRTYSQTSTMTAASIYHSAASSVSGDDDDDDDAFHDARDSSSQFITDSRFTARSRRAVAPSTQSVAPFAPLAPLSRPSQPIAPLSQPSPPVAPPQPVATSIPSIPIPQRVSPPTPPPAASPPATTPAPERPLFKLLSLGTDPLVLTVTTARSTGLAHFALDAKLGVVSGIIGAPQLRALLKLADSLPPAPSKPSSPTPSPKPAPALDVHAHIRGIVFLVLLDSAAVNIDDFHRHPLSAAPASTHLRVHLEGLDASLNTVSSLGLASSSVSVAAPTTTAKRVFTLALSDASVFAHAAARGYAPLLLTDAHLPAQYPAGATFPSFDTADWTGAGAGTPHPRIAQWRVKPAAKRPGAPATLALGVHVEGQIAEVELAPLRVFVDLRVVESVLGFTKSLGLEGRSNGEDDDEDEETPPATPRASDQTHRLLDDLDAAAKLENDRSMQTVLRCPCVRVEVRVPTARSGAIVLDVHDIRLNSGDAAEPRERPGVTFAADGYPPSSGKYKVLLRAEWKRIVVAYAGPGDTRATTLLSLHSDAPSSLAVRKSSLEVTLPAAHGLLSKPVLDGLQYWADDLTQWAERTFGSPSPPNSSVESDVIGSRWFEHRAESLASSSAGSGYASGMQRKAKATEMVVRVVLQEANVQMFMARASSDGSIRPLTLSLADMDLLLESKPEGRNETLITLSFMDLRIVDKSANDDTVDILGLTSERTFSSPAHPLVKLRFASSTDAGSGAKEIRVRLTLYGFTYTLSSDLGWLQDLAAFVKNPPGTFEAVVPTERTRISIKIIDGSVHVVAAGHDGAVALALTDMELATELLGDSPDIALTIDAGELALFAVDDMAADVPDELHEEGSHLSGQDVWRSRGYAVLVEITDFASRIVKQTAYPKVAVDVNSVKLTVHACADTLGAVGGFASAFGKAIAGPQEAPPPVPTPKPAGVHSLHRRAKRGDDIMASVDDNAFRRLPAVGSAPDLVTDDLPRNMNYIDVSYGTAAGLVALPDDGEEDDEGSYLVRQPPPSSAPGVVSEFGGETIRMLDPNGIHVIDDYFENLPPDVDDLASGEQELRVRVSHCDVTVLLYDGYDWSGTRRAIEDEMRRIRRRLEKIRQLLADGQTPDDTIEDTSALLFNSVHIGLRESPDELDPGALLVAIDEELGDDDDAASVSSWQSLTPMDPAMRGKKAPQRQRQHRGGGKTQRRLRRSAKPLIEIRLSSIALEMDKLAPECAVASRILVGVRDLEILDHIKTSTWRKFLTGKRTDAHGNVRETGSNMARVELVMVRPVPGHPSEEARLKAKILPLRLHVDQDALDFLKKFAAFRDPRVAAPPSPAGPSSNDTFFQHVEIFPVDLKLDYKPKRVDFQALRDGKTIELMNFFHFDGAEMTLRHLTLSGLTGWPRLFDTLNDLWTPDVKANQLADVISGVAPIRSIVNVGSGVADLVLLPIAQYKKDKRLLRGVQRGATSFVRSTAMEALRLGARLATGTQVILEHAEGVLGGRAPEGTLEVAVSDDGQTVDSEEKESKYAQQPGNVREGMRGAVKSLRTNLNSAAQTILAVPMEVHDSSEGTLHTVVRAVPIAVLRPMIGASEAVSKTLFGLRNTLDPGIMEENEAKYKRR